MDTRKKWYKELNHCNIIWVCCYNTSWNFIMIVTIVKDVTIFHHLMKYPHCERLTLDSFFFPMIWDCPDVGIMSVIEIQIPLTCCWTFKVTKIFNHCFLKFSEYKKHSLEVNFSLNLFIKESNVFSITLCGDSGN